MRNLLYFCIIGCFMWACSGVRNIAAEEDDPYADSLAINNDTVRIANDSLEYEILIIEPGFSTFLASRAKPEGYYTLNYLENKNRSLVADYNQRVHQPGRYDTDIYAQEINYAPYIDYGYEVNYKLYNYFVFLSYRYNQRFSVPTRL